MSDMINYNKKCFWKMLKIHDLCVIQKTNLQKCFNFHELGATDGSSYLSFNFSVWKLQANFSFRKTWTLLKWRYPKIEKWTKKQLSIISNSRVCYIAHNSPYVKPTPKHHFKKWHTWMRENFNNSVKASSKNQPKSSIEQKFQSFFQFTTVSTVCPMITWPVK